MRAIAKESGWGSELTVIGRKAPLLRGRYDVFVESQGERLFRASGGFTAVYEALEGSMRADGLELLKAVAKEIRDPKASLTGCLSRKELLVISSIAGQGRQAFRGNALKHDVVGSPLSDVLRKLTSERLLRPEEVVYTGGGIAIGYTLTEKGRIVASMLVGQGQSRGYCRDRG